MNKAENLAIDQLVFEVELRSNMGRNLNIELVLKFLTFKNVTFPYKSNIIELYIKQRRINLLDEGLLTCIDHVILNLVLEKKLSWQNISYLFLKNVQCLTFQVSINLPVSVTFLYSLI